MTTAVQNQWQGYIEELESRRDELLADQSWSKEDLIILAAIARDGIKALRWGYNRYSDLLAERNDLESAIVHQVPPQVRTDLADTLTPEA